MLVFCSNRHPVASNKTTLNSAKKIKSFLQIHRYVATYKSSIIMGTQNDLGESFTELTVVTKCDQDLKAERMTDSHSREKSLCEL